MPAKKLVVVTNVPARAPRKVREETESTDEDDTLGAPRSPSQPPSAHGGRGEEDEQPSQAADEVQPRTICILYGFPCEMDFSHHESSNRTRVAYPLLMNGDVTPPPLPPSPTRV